jgi:hypothetical protein
LAWIEENSRLQYPRQRCEKSAPIVNICPNPARWHEIYERLLSASAERDLEKPPKALILNGWAATNDVEKAERWAETANWAERHGLTDLVTVQPQDWYAVEEPSSYEVGPLGGPLYLQWRSESAAKPSNDAVKTALDKLSGNWAAITPELAPFTRPSAFTGTKMRRLLVTVLKGAPPPPWGHWDSLPNDQSRREFTDLRKRVNRAIAPLEIDHIDFEFDRTS